jgi:hypothetical protein
MGKPINQMNLLHGARNVKNTHLFLALHRAEGQSSRSDQFGRKDFATESLIGHGTRKVQGRLTRSFDATPPVGLKKSPDYPY